MNKEDKSRDSSELEQIVFQILFDPLQDLHKNESELAKVYNRHLLKALAFGMGAGAVAFIAGVYLFAGLRYSEVLLGRGQVLVIAALASICGFVAALSLIPRKLANPPAASASNLVDPKLYRAGTGLSGHAIRSVSQRIAATMRERVAEEIAKELESARQEIADDDLLEGEGSDADESSRVPQSVGP